MFFWVNSNGRQILGSKCWGDEEKVSTTWNCNHPTLYVDKFCALFRTVHSFLFSFRLQSAVALVAFMAFVRLCKYRDANATMGRAYIFFLLNFLSFPLSLPLSLPVFPSDPIWLLFPNFLLQRSRSVIFVTLLANKFEFWNGWRMVGPPGMQQTTPPSVASCTCIQANTPKWTNSCSKVY